MEDLALGAAAGMTALVADLALGAVPFLAGFADLIPPVALATLAFLAGFTVLVLAGLAALAGFALAGLAGFAFAPGFPVLAEVLTAFFRVLLGVADFLAGAAEDRKDKPS